MPTGDQSDFLTKTQAAIKVDLCERSIERAISAGELSAMRRQGRVMINALDLDQWVKNRQPHAKTPGPVLLARAIREINSLVEKEI